MFTKYKNIFICNDLVLKSRYNISKQKPVTISVSICVQITAIQHYGLSMLCYQLLFISSTDSTQNPTSMGLF